MFLITLLQNFKIEFINENVEVEEQSDLFIIGPKKKTLKFTKLK